MPISVFPERMDKLDPEDVNASLRTLETYIHYICERTEYAITNTFRTTNGLGSSAEAISLVLQETVDDLSSLTGEVGALASTVSGKVDKVEGMGLSSNDYTDADKEDVDTIDGLADRVTNLEEQGGEANVIEIVKRNGTALPVSGKAVDVTVPTRVSELTNDSGYQNAQQVQAAVSAGLAFLLISETYGPAAVVSFSSETEGLPLKKCQVDIAPVQAGSGDPSPSNVRAISGWTGAKVHVTGKNLFDSDVLLQASGWAKSNGEYYGDNQQFYLAFRTSSNPQGIFGKNMGLGQVSISFWAKGTASGNNLYVMVYYTDGSYDRITINSTAYKKYTFTSDPAKTIGVIGGSYSQHGTSYFKDFQIELGGTVTEYEAFGKRAAVSFPAEAGTVYGGVLDVLAGILTVTYGYIASYAGESLPGAWISDRDVYAAGKTPTTGAQVVYALASPVTYQLTPQTVTTLAGQNNVWADCGNVTVEYGAFLVALQAEIERLQEGGN